MWNNPRLLNMIANALYALFAVMLLGAAIAWLVQRPLFRLQSIQVEPMPGRELTYVNSATIRTNLTGRIQGSFFTVNLESIRQSFETVPWVRHASVRRVWPNGLVVTIEEHEPLGTWGPGELGKLVNTFGEVFVANPAEAEEQADLIAFHGPEGTSHDVVAKMQIMEAWLKPLGARIEALTLTSRYAWSARLDNGLQIDFGREQNEQDRQAMEVRALRFASAWPQVVARWGKQIEYADLRYPNGFAIRAAGMRFLNDGQVRKTRQPAR